MKRLFLFFGGAAPYIYFQGLPCQGKGTPLYLDGGIGGYNEDRSICKDNHENKWRKGELND